MQNPTKIVQYSRFSHPDRIKQYLKLVGRQHSEQIGEKITFKVAGSRGRPTVDSFLRVHNDAFGEKLAGLADGYFSEDVDGLMLFAGLNDNTEGYAYTNAQDGVCFLDEIAVSSALRGKGIGSELLDLSCRLAFEMGYRTFELRCNNDDDKLPDWYSERGFRPLKKVGSQVELTKSLESGVSLGLREPSRA